MQLFRCGFYQTFGASEAGGFTTYLSPTDHERIVESGQASKDASGASIMPCGREVQGFHIRVVGEHGRDVSTGQPGEMWIKSDSVMSGYWNRPEETADVLQDGWLKSGDVAVQDQDGLVSVIDRKRDMIISGGYNIYSNEVEAVILQHPAVAEAAVVGVPDAYWGEVVVAFVVTHPGQCCDPADLAKSCEGGLASYKRPRSFHLVEALPKTSTGKIRKFELRETARGITFPTPAVRPVSEGDQLRQSGGT